ncbi:hypothetical protein GA0070622_3427 [Micromonospora sediminicola]|uniref:Uncharacterized protein n=1 Tax=Micromonospora sediminicola TaxID=946078 RepID=A0A1A9BBY8_9ACTN|nr:hypothetical protein [Micromonospora sediminicola]SBT66407.1 hypothetical protein GA0070622_3427 [Micromonospora sediminicola]
MHPRRPDDRAESDRLLDAARLGAPAPDDGDPLIRLLAAAAAPASADELAGEERALAAFRAARAAPPPAPAPRARRRLRVAAALSGLAATAVAGVAFAAVGLDRNQEPTAPPVPTTAGPSGAGPSGAGPSRPAPSTPTGEASGAATSPAPPPPSRSATAPPVDRRLAGHCRAYLAKPEPQRAKALTTPGFAELVAAAGGADRVEGYCRALEPSAAGKPPKPKPTPESKSKSKPPGPPDDEDDDQD